MLCKTGVVQEESGPKSVAADIPSKVSLFSKAARRTLAASISSQAHQLNCAWGCFGSGGLGGFRVDAEQAGNFATGFRPCGAAGAILWFHRLWGYVVRFAPLCNQDAGSLSSDHASGTSP